MLDLLALCRQGFEKDCAAELQAATAALAVPGYPQTTTGTGYVQFKSVAQEADAWAEYRARLRGLKVNELVFARQLFVAEQQVSPLQPTDRIAQLLPAIRQILGENGGLAGDVFVETADAEASAPVKKLCRKLLPALRNRLRKDGLLAAEPSTSLPCLHLFLPDFEQALVGLADHTSHYPWPMGIPRIKVFAGAPSRSAAKIEEALTRMLTAEERTAWVKPQMRVVDLGAAPGGWSWQFAQRGCRLICVDNGPLAPRLLEEGSVTHIRADGYDYMPSKPVDWMICDIVDKPARTTQLVIRWLQQGWCKQAIVNLKLPMKQRYAEVMQAAERLRQQLDAADQPLDLRIRHLYHDREEVTCFIRQVPVR